MAVTPNPVPVAWEAVVFLISGTIILAMIRPGTAFGLAFWLAFLMHALAAEIWLWRRPT